MRDSVREVGVYGTYQRLGSPSYQVRTRSMSASMVGVIALSDLGLFMVMRMTCSAGKATLSSSEWWGTLSCPVVSMAGGEGQRLEGAKGESYSFSCYTIIDECDGPETHGEPSDRSSRPPRETHGNFITTTTGALMAVLIAFYVHSASSHSTLVGIRLVLRQTRKYSKRFSRHSAATAVYCILSRFVT